MTPHPDKILSASRRTDIPAFYMDWFMHGIQQGVFHVKNPYTKTVTHVTASRDVVHSIVFWSKNYDEFITSRAGEDLTRQGFNLYFNFTLNSESAVLEPMLPSLKTRLDQLTELANLFGPEKIAWRFDPICFYGTGDTGSTQNNLSDFPVILEHASRLGIEKCVTSFFDHYPKIQTRLNRLFQKNPAPFFFNPPSMEKRTAVIRRMEKLMKGTKTTLYLCCEREVFSALAGDTGVRENSCIDGRLMKHLFGGSPEIKRDYGQRAKKGCHCTRSIDVGDYDLHPCYHNCLFCYATPQMDLSLKKALRHNEN